MPTAKSKATRERTKMEAWLFFHRVTYRELATVIGDGWDHRSIWEIARGLNPTEVERSAIIKGLHKLGHKCLPSDLWESGGGK